MEKRLANILLSLLLVVFFSPFILLLLLLIWLETKEASLIKLPRVGKDGNIFYIYKIRTMWSNTLEVTKIGKFLRELGVDELPQLINVIKGQMSLVGPRPEMPEIVKNYTEYQKQRLKVLPGVTGLWQISPYRNEPIHNHLEYDLEYIKNKSVLFDFKILFLTLKWLFLELFRII